MKIVITLDEMHKELEQAIKELDDEEERDSRRDTGSMVQDARREKTIETLKKRVQDIQHRIDNYKISISN